MKPLYPTPGVKAFFTSIKHATLSVATLFVGSFAYSQIANPLSAIPELIFTKPQLVSAPNTGGQDGAVYQFKKVIGANIIAGAPGGVDALLTITGRGTNNSSYPASGVRLANVDIGSNGTDGNGYDNAWQPQLTYDLSADKQSTTPSINNFDWWMEFQVTFVQDNDNTKPVNLTTFDITGLDIDGNGSNVKEYIEFYGLNTFTLENPTSLIVEQIKSGNAVVGNRYVGPYTNSPGIDVSATKVEATNHYTNFSGNSFKFRIGARSIESASGTGVERMFSLWFKSILYTNPVQSSLPVSLFSFTAQLNNKKVMLGWVTAIEVNTSHFVIQRSLDGKSFDDDAIVFTEGNSSVRKEYSFADNIASINSGLIYYRLKMVDLDAKYKYSDIVVVRLANDQLQTTILAYPNPAVNELRVTIPGEWQNKTIAYSVYNSNGSLMKQKVNSSAGQTETFHIDDLPIGLYIVKAANGNETSVQRFMKINN